MKFRNLLAAISLFVAVSVNSIASSSTPESVLPPRIVVRGLVMLQLERPDALYIATPDASDHKATMTVLLKSGETHTFAFKGKNAIKEIESKDSSPIVAVPELIRMKELYGQGVVPLLDRAANQIAIPWSVVQSVRTGAVTDARYTFVRQDTGEEVLTFRPRRVAESVEIDLTPAATLMFNGAKVDLSEVQEIRIEQVPKDMGSVNNFQAHFHHYLHYIARPAGEEFAVQPRKLTGGSSVPRVGNSFWIGAYILCDPVALD